MGDATPGEISRLTVVVQDQSKDQAARNSAAATLVEIAQNHPDYRGQCAAILTSTLERYQRNPIELNTSLIAHLITLKAAESAAMVQQVVRANEYDRAALGDWGYISKKLGVVENRASPAAPAAKKAPLHPPATSSTLGSTREASQEAEPAKPQFFSPDPAAAAATIAAGPRLSPREKDKLRAKRKQERKSKKQNRRR